MSEPVIELSLNWREIAITEFPALNDISLEVRSEQTISHNNHELRAIGVRRFKLSVPYREEPNLTYTRQFRNSSDITVTGAVALPEIFPVAAFGGPKYHYCDDLKAQCLNIPKESDILPWERMTSEIVAQLCNRFFRYLVTSQTENYPLEAIVTKFELRHLPVSQEAADKKSPLNLFIASGFFTYLKKEYSPI